MRAHRYRISRRGPELPSSLYQSIPSRDQRSIAANAPPPFQQRPPRNLTGLSLHLPQSTFHPPNTPELLRTVLRKASAFCRISSILVKHLTIF